ncbi:DNA alkylation repair protein [Limisalsivibrio acetivorans]|uniref:DNA alkylation repair protein n=1 Tax=Limisalsivibrio acetivorans TaxID=1304888 RepID=UPI0003B57158|nr:DNA alkylation repair protein [Limisalsivibrio acetivorans]
MKRKGAKTIKEIPADILKKLNSGEIEAVNLPEGLAVNQHILMQNTFPELPAHMLAKVKGIMDEGVTKRMKLCGEVLHEAYGRDIIPELLSHPSDTVRGWGAYAVGAMEDVHVDERLRLIRPFADDSHYSVREWAWIAVRKDIINELEASLNILADWSLDSSEAIRRFASEATRPRGVWAPHIKALRLQPEMGEPVLEPLKDDASKYVQDSAANWINDASKDRPDWAKGICERWLCESPSQHTERICRRGLRTLNKQR